VRKSENSWQFQQAFLLEIQLPTYMLLLRALSSPTGLDAQRELAHFMTKVRLCFHDRCFDAQLPLHSSTAFIANALTMPQSSASRG